MEGQARSSGVALPTAQFGGGQPRKLTLELLFDVDRQQARRQRRHRPLFKMMEVDRPLGSGRARTAAGRRW